MFGWFTKLLNNARGARKQLGNKGEIEAAEFLEKLGYKILHRQLRSRFGELDLVALDGQTVVFVEVKTRASTAAGHPTESITLAKQGNITRSALAFLKRHRWLNRRARFDVVAIIWPKFDEPPKSSTTSMPSNRSDSARCFPDDGTIARRRRPVLPVIGTNGPPQWPIP